MEDKKNVENNRSGWLAVINGKIPLKRRRSIQKELGKYKVETKTTSISCKATDIIREKKDFEGFLSVGGDGTLHETINGIDLEHQKIILIPSGTINCLARFLKIKTPSDGIQLLKNGSLKRVDLLSLLLTNENGTTYHTYAWGFIAFGRLVNITTLAGKITFLPGFLKYPVATIVNHFINRKAECKLSLNRTKPGSRTFSSLILNNATASHFCAIPAWDMQDGLAEFQILNHNHVSQFVNSFSRFIKIPVNLSWINQIHSLSCEFQKPVDMMADGEILKSICKLELTVEKGECLLVIPPGKELKYRIRGFNGKWKGIE